MLARVPRSVAIAIALLTATNGLIAPAAGVAVVPLTRPGLDTTAANDAYAETLQRLIVDNELGVLSPLPGTCDSRLATEASRATLYEESVLAMTNLTAVVDRFAAVYGAQWPEFPKAEFVAHADASSVTPPPAGSATPGPTVTLPGGATLPSWATLPPSDATLPPGMTLPSDVTLPPLPPMSTPPGMTLPNSLPPGLSTAPGWTLPQSMPAGMTTAPGWTLPQSMPAGMTTAPGWTLPQSMPAGMTTAPGWTLPSGVTLPPVTMPPNVPPLPPLPGPFARVQRRVAAQATPDVWASRMRLLKHLVVWADWQVSFGGACLVRVADLTTPPSSHASQSTTANSGPTTATTMVHSPTAVATTSQPARATPAPTHARFAATVTAAYNESVFKAKMVAYLRQHGVSDVTTNDIVVEGGGSSSNSITFYFTGHSAGLAASEASSMRHDDQRDMGLASMSAPTTAAPAAPEDDGGMGQMTLAFAIGVPVAVVLCAAIVGAVLVKRARATSAARTATREYADELGAPMAPAQPRNTRAPEYDLP